MSEPFLGEIRLFAFNFAPAGWAHCDGDLLPINQYQSLYSLLGTMYGGDGETTFGLPDLLGRSPMHRGTSTQGAKSGNESVFLNQTQIPSHRHNIQATSDDATANTPNGNVFARATTPLYHDHVAGNNQTINSGTLTTYGSGQGHNNMQPSLVMNYCINLTGLFPSRN